MAVVLALLKCLETVNVGPIYLGYLVLNRSKYIIYYIINSYNEKKLE